MVSIVLGSAAVYQLVSPYVATASKRGSTMGTMARTNAGTSAEDAVAARVIGLVIWTAMPSRAAGMIRYFGIRFRIVPLGAVCLRIALRAAVMLATAARAFVPVRFLCVPWNSGTPSAMFALAVITAHTASLSSVAAAMPRPAGIRLNAWRSSLRTTFLVIGTIPPQVVSA